MKKHAMLFSSVVLAAGCAQTVTPHYDMRFGEALREGQMAMTIDPDAGLRGDDARGIDGRAAQESVKRYQDSFRRPPPVTNVINIGGNLGNSNGGGNSAGNGE
jgi:hypothetical protein